MIGNNNVIDKVNTHFPSSPLRLWNVCEPTRYILLFQVGDLPPLLREADCCGQLSGAGPDHNGVVDFVNTRGSVSPTDTQSARLFGIGGTHARRQ